MQTGPDPSTDEKKLAPLQRAALALQQMRERLDAAERAHCEPVAVVGVGCRFPGGVSDPESFWRLLVDGVDAITEVPADRWDLDAYYDRHPGTPGKMYTCFGGFVDDVDCFDAELFGISPREAANMDPQQRVLLEVCWETLERAGYPPVGAQPSTGVFVGTTTNDYGQTMLMSRGLSSIDLYYGGGNALHALAGRVSYLLGLQGPAMVLDTACSSSLVTVHLAAQSLRAGECDLALAGGVNLVLAPEWTVIISQSQMLSPDGRCKTFDASADGYVRSEGCGILALKRLSDAEADGDDVLAVIRGSAINHGGAGSGLTVPNGSAQQRVIRAALDAAGVAPGDIDYVEAHGTGTSLGDPIEMGALAAVFAPGRRAGEPLLVGSVKTNLGHLESAAGVAGLIKTVLALRRATIPAHLHLIEPSPHIPWDEIPVIVPTERVPWPNDAKEKVAGVSSFGVSGINAHVIVSEAPAREVSSPMTARSPHVLPISARTPDELRELMVKYRCRLDDLESSPVTDICFTASTGRVHFNERLAVIGASRAELGGALEKTAAGGSTPHVHRGTVDGQRRTRIAFLFSGQGAQYVGMGRQLYECEPVFRNGLDHCDEILRRHLEFPLLSVLHGEPGGHRATLLNETGYTQPALFALEYALAELWRSWGIEPSVVLGHSVGEYAAACVAGVFSLEDGLRLIAERAQLMQSLSNDGAMRAVMADVERVRAAVEPVADRVSVAAINGPDSTVISGDRATVQGVAKALEGQGVESRELRVSHGFHSPLMDSILDEFEQIAGTVKLAPQRLRLISNVTGEVADNDTLVQPTYWREHIRSPVRFADSVRAAVEQECNVFLEIGPGTTLLGLAQGCVSNGAIRWLPSLRNNRDDLPEIISSLAALYVSGADVDWKAFHAHTAGHRVALPTYPFQRRRHWFEAGEDADLRRASQPAPPPLDTQDAETLAGELESSGELSVEEARALPRILEVLAARQAREDESVKIQEWLYEVRWEEVAMPSRVSTARSRGTWILCADEGSIAKTLASALEARGENCRLLHPGDFSRGRLSRVLADAIGDTTGTRVGVVFLGALDTVAAASPPLNGTTNSASVLEAEQRHTCGGLLEVIQVLLAMGHAPSPRLWAVTRGAVPAGADGPLGASAPGPPGHATLWGLARVAAIESPELWAGVIDLAPHPEKADPERLSDALISCDEDQLALRGARAYAPRLRRCPQRRRGSIALRSDASYLVTGGLGGLGLEVARWLVGRGARNLMLLGRSGNATAAARDGVAGLEKAGARVIVAKADVARADELEARIEQAEAELGPLGGVVHAAGIADNALLRDQSWERFAPVLAPKVQGGWNLHALTRDRDLQFFVSFSSTAALLGHDGQSNYAAANAYLDALSHYRRSLGLVATSIDFGPWAETGMASADGLTDHFAARGLTRMGSVQALSALARALEDGATQIGVVDANWPRILAQYPDTRIPSHLRSMKPTTTVEAGYAPDVPGLTRETLAASPAEQRATLLLDYTSVLVMRVLGYSSPTSLDLDRSLLELGLDSLMGMQLRNGLLEDLGVAVPLSAFLEGGSVRQIADTVLGELEDVVDAVAPAEIDAEFTGIGPEQARVLLGRLNDLSDEEVSSLLGTMLNGSGSSR